MIYPNFMANKHGTSDKHNIRFIFLISHGILQDISHFETHAFSPTQDWASYRYVPPDPSYAPGEAWRDPAASHRGTCLGNETRE